jgi:hypothetical protein
MGVRVDEMHEVVQITERAVGWKKPRVSSRLLDLVEGRCSFRRSTEDLSAEVDYSKLLPG